MSVHGGVSSGMTILDYTWTRRIDEYGPTDVLRPGWDLKITLAWFEIDLESYGWKGTPWSRLRKSFHFYKPCELSFAGYKLGISRSWEIGKRHTFGDASERILN